MTGRKNRHELLYPLGVTPTEEGAKILVQAEGKKVSLLLFRRGEKKAAEVIDFQERDRVGDVWSMTLKEYDLENMEYGFQCDGQWMPDPCARMVTGREKWGDLSRAGKPVRARLLTGEFDWEDDVRPEIPYSDSIIYRLHVRGFTKHRSSGVKDRGTFGGIWEKIPYLKELGVTAVELLPVTEFDEVMVTEPAAGIPGQKPEATGRINYWGYGPSFLYALKASYGSGETEPEREFKELVKALHRENMRAFAYMLSLSAGALAASGLGSVTTMSGAGAEADKAGSVTINTTMCALELDDAGKITAVSFDIAQNKVGFDATGALTGELTGEHPTKKELGDGYGMKAASGIGKEWFEQAEALEDWCVGKTVEEVVTMPTYDKGDGRHTQVPDDVDLKTGCTIDMGSFLNALQEAADNAK